MHRKNKLELLKDSKNHLDLKFGRHVETVGSLTRPWELVEASLERGFRRLEVKGSFISDDEYRYAQGFLRGAWNRLNLPAEEADERLREAYKNYFGTL